MKQSLNFNLKLIERKLNQREKIAVAVGGGALLLFLVIQLIIVPLVSRGDRLRRDLAAKESAVQEMTALKAEYEVLKKQAEMANVQVSDRDKGFNLFSFLEKLAGDAGVKEQIAYMKPSTVNQPNSKYRKLVVEMKMQGITMEKLAVFIHSVETSKNMVFVRRLSISRKAKEEGVITAVMQMETVES